MYESFRSQQLSLPVRSHSRAMILIRFFSSPMLHRFPGGGIYIRNIKCWSGARNHIGMCTRQYIVVWLWFDTSQTFAVSRAVGAASASMEMGWLLGRHQFRHEIRPEIFRCTWNRRWCQKSDESAQQSSRTKGKKDEVFAVSHCFRRRILANVIWDIFECD